MAADLPLTIYAVCVVIAVTFLAGAVVCRLLSGRRALTSEEWIDASFIGVAVLMLPLQNGFYLGLPVGRAAWPLLAIILIVALLFIVRGRFGRLQDLPIVPFAIAAGGYVVQGIGLFLVGVDRYLGRAWGDQFNYVAMAEFAARYPASAMFSRGLPPFAWAASTFMDVRIGQSVLLAFFSRIVPAAGKVLFEPTILLIVPLVVLAIYATARAAALPESVSRAAGATAGVLPAVAYVHLESFFSQAIAVPLLIYVVPLCGRAVRTDDIAVFIKLALVIGALGAVYPEFVPLAFACVLVMAAIGMWRASSRWRWVAGTLLVFVAPFALNVGQRLWSRWTNIGQPVLGFLYPWAFSLEGLQRLWLGDPSAFGGVGTSMVVRILGLALTALGYVGLLLMLLSNLRPAVRRSAEGAPSLVVALCVAGVSAAPLLIAARDFDHAYQFYKLMLTIAPFLVVGIGYLVSSAARRWGSAKMAAWSVVLVCALGVPAAWGTLAMGIESATPPAHEPRVRDNTFFTLHDGFIGAQTFLERQHGRQIALCVGDVRGPGGYLNGWLSYFARDNHVWALNPTVNDQTVSILSGHTHLDGFPSPLPSDVLLLTNDLDTLWADGAVPPTVWGVGMYQATEPGRTPFALACHVRLRTHPGTRTVADLTVTPDHEDVALVSNHDGDASLIVQPADAATSDTMSRVEVVIDGQVAASRVMDPHTWAYTLRLRSGLNRMHIGYRHNGGTDDASTSSNPAALVFSSVRLLLTGP